MIEYNHINKSKFTLADCEAMIGKSAQLHLTGEIIDAGESGGGPYVTFKVDERWGFGEYSIRIDLDTIQGFH